MRADIVAGARHLQDEEGYLSLFQDATERQVACDGSTSYLRFPQAIEAIAARGDDVKAIAVYRDPVELVSSYHLFLLNEAWETEQTLEAAWAVQDRRRNGEAIPTGARRPSALVYADVARLGQQIAHAKKTLGHRLRTYEMREVTRNTARVSAEIQEWIGVPIKDLGALPHTNPARAPRSDTLSRFVKNPPPAIKAAKNQLKRILGLSSLGVVKRINTMNETVVSRKVSDDMRNTLRSYFLEDVMLLETVVERDLRKDWGWI